MRLPRAEDGLVEGGREEDGVEELEGLEASENFFMVRGVERPLFEDIAALGRAENSDMRSGEPLFVGTQTRLTVKRMRQKNR